MYAIISVATFPNIGFIYRGYDIFKGYPEAKSVDPGFRESIFEPSYSKNKKTPDQRYEIPNSIGVLNIQSCSGRFESKTFFTQKEYQKDLAVKAGISVEGFFAGSFSASVDYQKTQKTIASSQSIVVESNALCNIYKANILSYEKPKFTQNFIKGLKQLKDGTTQSKSRFLSAFGTHYVRDIKMGSRYTKRFTITKESKEKMEKEGINVNMAASILSGSSFNMNVDTKTEWNNKFQSSAKSEETASYGSLPPTDGMLQHFIAAHITCLL